jgi:hypothetical protein
MSVRLLILLIAAIPAVTLEGQAPLPPDINPVTLSRMPPVTPADLDAEGQKLLAARTNVTPGPGPGHLGIYNPKASEGTGLLGRALGVPTGEMSRLGPRTYQLVVLITAREIDQQYEWSAHEPAGLRVGLEQSVIDVVKFDRDVKGLAEKVSSELFARQIQQFGRQNTIEIIQLMGDYFIAGTMNAADQQLPPTRQPLMPALTRGR